MRLLLVEDDPMIGKSIREGMRREGHAVDWVRDGWAAEQSLRSEAYDLVLLDLGLPRIHGLEVLRNARRGGSDVPILIITARDEIEDRIKGLDAGADDYLVKPFNLSELSARVRALMRRSAGRANPVLRHGDIEVDPAAFGVRYKGREIAVSQREFALLECLLRRPGAVVSKTQLEQCVYGWGEEVESNAVEVHVSNLRKKLSPDAIVTVRGIGYRTK